MQTILRVFIVFSLFFTSHHLSAQSDVIITVFEDVNGDGLDEGVGISLLAGELSLFEDIDGSGTGDAGEEVAIA